MKEKGSDDRTAAAVLHARHGESAARRGARQETLGQARRRRQTRRRTRDRAHTSANDRARGAAASESIEAGHRARRRDPPRRARARRVQRRRRFGCAAARARTRAQADGRRSCVWRTSITARALGMARRMRRAARRRDAWRAASTSSRSTAPRQRRSGVARRAVRGAGRRSRAPRRDGVVATAHHARRSKRDGAACALARRGAEGLRGMPARRALADGIDLARPLLARRAPKHCAILPRARAAVCGRSHQRRSRAAPQRGARRARGAASALSRPRRGGRACGRTARARSRQATARADLRRAVRARLAEEEELRDIDFAHVEAAVRAIERGGAGAFI